MRKQLEKRGFSFQELLSHVRDTDQRPAWLVRFSYFLIVFKNPWINNCLMMSWQLTGSCTSPVVSFFVSNFSYCFFQKTRSISLSHNFSNPVKKIVWSSFDYTSGPILNICLEYSFEASGCDQSFHESSASSVSRSSIDWIDQIEHKNMFKAYSFNRMLLRRVLK